jgi:4-deoxy-L-threo-5-hexosulose-uronate ketol-isomerase
MQVSWVAGLARPPKAGAGRGGGQKPVWLDARQRQWYTRRPVPAGVNDAMKTHLMPDPERYPRMTTEELRGAFLIEDLFQPGTIVTHYLDMDRTIVGSVVPRVAPLILGAAEELRSAYFLERRELGVLLIGGKGKVTADGTVFDMETLDCLYVGRGTKEVKFESADPGQPAQFYLLSYPAHATHPTMMARKKDAAAVPLGKPEMMNKRTIYKYIHAGGIRSCQLVMGFTELDAGSGWNTMPPHTHMRRSEVYLYFNLPADARVFHMMGGPEETRHLLVANGQVALSPSWSIHAGIGTQNYTFCWGMGGENQAFDDMDAVPVTSLR